MKKVKSTKPTTAGKKVTTKISGLRALGSKLSATMAAMLARMEREAPRSRMFQRTLASRSAGAAPSEQAVHIFVRCDPQTEGAVARGVELNGAGSVRTALVPLSRVSEIAAHSGVTRISAPRELRPLLDVARPLVRVPQFRTQTRSSGQGVIVGIVDSGIDVTHRAFAGGRILSLWDQTARGSGPGGNFVRLGKVLTGAAMARSRDRDGHGTHVAGIAAGAAAPYEGVAPKADIVMVKTNFQNTGIAEGVRWIFSEAARLNRPAVVNLSLGGHGDAHDGSDDLSTVLDQQSGPGRIVVAAAGNEGTDEIHAVKRVTAGQVATYRLRVAPASSGAHPAFFLLNGWYRGAGTCEVRLRSSTGVATGWQPVLNANPTARTYTLQNDRAEIATPPASVNPNGDHQFFIAVEPQAPGQRVQGGNWTLEVRHSAGQPGDVHVWLLLPSDAPATAAGFAGAAFTHLIGSPGSAQEVVTVASYTSRNQWVDAQGNSQAVGLGLNTISDFSSPGPRRDGVRKPDVAAPGAMIVSCLSSASLAHTRAADIVAPGFVVNAGTSMATPFIAGVIALLLEGQPTLTPAAAKAFLKQRSRVPGGAAGVHDPKWGYGLLKL